MMRESLMGSNSTAIQRFQDDLEKNKSELNAKIQEVLRQKYELEESHVKYVNLKKKIRLFQSHWKNKEEKYKESLQKTEDEFRAKLFKLRDKMQEVYDSKINEVSNKVHVPRILSETIRETVSSSFRLNIHFCIVSCILLPPPN